MLPHLSEYKRLNEYSREAAVETHVKSEAHKREIQIDGS